MILIDMPMPARCVECPCAAFTRTSSKDMRTMCRAMQAAGRKYVLVNDWADVRPEDCPIRMEVISGSKSFAQEK